MGSTSTKKKFSFGKLLIWIIVILVGLHIFTDGESTDELLSLFEGNGYYQSDYEQQPGYLGITISKTESINGGYISEVKPDSPGANAGLLPGDIVITIGSTPINSYDDMVAEISTFYAGDCTAFTVLRNDQHISLWIVFGTKPYEVPQETTGSGNSVTTPAVTNPPVVNPPVVNPPVVDPPVVNPPVTNPPQVDLLPSVPTDLRNHVYLASRGKGYCEKLTGKVVVTVIFVSDPEGAWSEAEINESKAELQSIADRISADAAGYGAQVSISFSYKTVSTSEKIVNNVTDAWMASALSAAGLPTLKESNPKLESHYGVDAAPVCFFANHGGRAFASGSYGSEYSIIYDDTHAFYHELNHVFGAKDFYYPKEVEDLSKTYLPNSIMVSSSNGVMDDLTAYLIGWTDTLSGNALNFLKSTSYLTSEYLSEEHKKETYTGYVTNYTYGGGSYTGYLVNGVRHGQGKWIREDGTVWEGTFHHGSFTGYGNYIYESGAVYNGQWVNGKLHGKGTMTWADGNTYTGDFVAGKRTGKGTMTWADGGKYTGDFVDNNRTGQGTWTGNTGNTYTGGFLNGNFHGQGTYKWADGARYTGGYDNGKRSGQGTMVYSNGGVYTGQWVNGERSGQGKYTSSDGVSFYEGTWRNDKWNGQGTYSWASGDKYTGAYVDGKRHGYGIYYYSNGSRYEGNWSNGEKHGQGTMYYANGTAQSGFWENGKLKK